MTIHISYDHQCPKCGAFYIPYNGDVPCPQCGTVEGERFDFIPQAAGSLLYNLETYGCYVPLAWLTSSFADHVQSILFELFEAFESVKDGKDFATFAGEWLSEVDWGEQKYLEKHLLPMAIRINEELQRNLAQRDYSRLEEHFKNSTSTTETLTYEDIEKILGFELPEEAYYRRPWWANIRKGCSTHVWLNVGWKVVNVDVGKSVTFKKVET